MFSSPNRNLNQFTSTIVTSFPGTVRLRNFAARDESLERFDFSATTGKTPRSRRETTLIFESILAILAAWRLKEQIIRGSLVFERLCLGFRLAGAGQIAHTLSRMGNNAPIIRAQPAVTAGQTIGLRRQALRLLHSSSV